MSANTRKASKRAANAPGPSREPPDKRANKKPAWRPPMLPEEEEIKLTPCQCTNFMHIVSDFTKSAAFAKYGVLKLTIPMLYRLLVKNVQELLNDGSKEIGVKKQSVKEVQVSNDQSYLYLNWQHVDQTPREFVKKAYEKEELEGNDWEALLDDKGWRIPLGKWAYYASEISLINFFDSKMTPFHPNTFGKPIKVLLGGMDAPGISSKYEYIASRGTIFCPHIENACLNSINIHLMGAEKVWLVCAPADASKVEKMLAEKMNKPCHHSSEKTVILDPEELIKEGVSVHMVVQRPGDVIVTHANAYHSGFNAGLNIASSANTLFAVPPWKAALKKEPPSVPWEGNKCPKKKCKIFESLPVQEMMAKADKMTHEQFVAKTYPPIISFVKKPVVNAVPVAMKNPGAETQASTSTGPLASGSGGQQQGRAPQASTSREPQASGSGGQQQGGKVTRQNSKRKKARLVKQGKLAPAPRRPKHVRTQQPISQMGIHMKHNHIIQNLNEKHVLKYVTESDSWVAKHLRGEDVDVAKFESKAVPKLAFYYQANSFPCRAVFFTARAIGIHLTLRPSKLPPGQNLIMPEFTVINSQHSVPTIVGDKFVLSGSQEICVYLANKYGRIMSADIYPEDEKMRAEIDSKLQFNKETYQSFKEYYDPEKYSENKDNKQHKLKKAFEDMDKFLEGQEWVVGDAMTLADVCLTATVSTAVAVGFNIDNYSNVTDWLEKCQNTLPGYTDISESGVKMFKEALKNK